VGVRFLFQRSLGKGRFQSYKNNLISPNSTIFKIKSLTKNSELSGRVSSFKLVSSLALVNARVLLSIERLDGQHVILNDEALSVFVGDIERVEEFTVSQPRVGDVRDSKRLAGPN
jgi:hypothetical protein